MIVRSWKGRRSIRVFWGRGYLNKKGRQGKTLAETRWDAKERMDWYREQKKERSEEEVVVRQWNLTRSLSMWVIGISEGMWLGYPTAKMVWEWEGYISRHSKIKWLKHLTAEKFVTDILPSVATRWGWSSDYQTFLVVVNPVSHSWRGKRRPTIRIKAGWMECEDVLLRCLSVSSGKSVQEKSQLTTLILHQA